MPEVIFTPRVRVSLICTPSRMPLAASVRRNLVGDLLGRGDLLERERLGRVPQPGQVLVEPEDAPGVEPQSLPNRVAALDGGVERAHPGPVPVAEPAAHVDDQVAVALIVTLQHQ